MSLILLFLCNTERGQRRSPLSTLFNFFNIQTTNDQHLFSTTTVFSHALPPAGCQQSSFETRTSTRNCVSFSLFPLFSRGFAAKILKPLLFLSRELNFHKLILAPFIQFGLTSFHGGGGTLKPSKPAANLFVSSLYFLFLSNPSHLFIADVCRLLSLPLKTHPTIFLSHVQSNAVIEC